MVAYLLFPAGFFLLAKGASFLVDGASGIARALRVSDLVIGLTVVAFGTSFPELSVNVFASIEGNTEIAIGNILGSNTFNILLILGISAIICPLKVGGGTVWKEIPLTLFAAVILGILGNDKLIDGGGISALTRIDGAVLLSFFVIFLYYAFGAPRAPKNPQGDEPAKGRSLGGSFFLVILGLICLMIGAEWVVNGAVRLASALGVSESLIGLMIVAAGTSLPELATSCAAACKKNAEIALGNILGSNIFNVFFVLGVSSAIRPLPFRPQCNMDIGVTVISSLMLFICMFTGKRHILDRWEGALFILFYGSYAAFVIFRG